MTEIRSKAALWLVVSCLFSLFGSVGSLLAAPAESVQQALAQQQLWLGEGAKGDAWRTFLKTEELEKQLELGDQADVVVLREVLDAYQSQTPGLSSQRFVAVRDALAGWLMELSRPTLADLPQLTREAAAAFQPLNEQHVAASKKDLVAALADLNAMLARGGRKSQQGWRQFLEWEALQEQLAAGAAGDPKVLFGLLENYKTGVVGMELPRFAKVRHALQRYSDTFAFSNADDAQQQYEDHLAKLAEELAQYGQSPDYDTAYRIGHRLGWLRRAQQAPELIEAVRYQTLQPNFFLQASRQLVAAGIEREVKEQIPVTDVILGTSIRGTAHTTGNVKLALIPNDRQAELQIQMVGSANSNNVGYNGPVSISSVGRTQLNVRKRLLLDAEGLAGLPAQANAATQTSITGISANSNIAYRIAQRRVAQNQGQAQQIASQHAEERASRRMDAESAKLLANANNSLETKVKAPLRRRDAMPHSLRFRTTAEALYAVAVQATEYQIGAPHAPPELSGAYDLAIQMHETSANNLSESVLGGVTMTDEDLERIVKDLTGNVPEELKVTPDKDPWSITFNSQQPIVLLLDDGGYQVKIHGKRFSRGDQQIRQSMLITASYKIAQTEQGARLTRQGDVEVDYVNHQGRQSLVQVAFKTFMRKKFEALFEPEIVTDGLVLPGEWAKAGKLHLEQMSADKGWLVLGWNQPEPAVAAEAE